MEILGKHYIIDYYKCNSEKIANVDFIEKILLESTKLSKLSIVFYKFKQFKPYGVSGAIVIEESHITIHTWPEKNYVALDIFVCDKYSIPEKAIEYIKNKIEAEYYSINILERGYSSK